MREIVRVPQAEQPLAEYDPAVAEGAHCQCCGEVFRTGDMTCIWPEAHHADGLTPAARLHLGCAESLVETINERVAMDAAIKDTARRVHADRNPTLTIVAKRNGRR